MPLWHNQQIPLGLQLEQEASWELCDVPYIHSLMIQHQREANIHLSPLNEET